MNTARDTIELYSIPEPNSGCWLWLAALSVRGYGQMTRSGDRTKRAHVVSYEAFIGPVPDGLVLDHKCHTKSCVNPLHLEPVPTAENVRRHFRLQTHCKRGHELTADNLYYHRHGRRQCATCKREAVALRRARVGTHTHPSATRRQKTMSFDEEHVDQHGECAAEIHRLQATVERLRDALRQCRYAAASRYKTGAITSCLMVENIANDTLKDQETERDD